MRKIAWMLLTLPLLQAGDPGGRARFIGGTVPALPSKSEGIINMTDEESFLFQAKTTSAVRIPYQEINVLEYGQRVGRRYAAAILISPMLLVSKKRNHFVTIGYRDKQGNQQALVFQVDKRDVRFILAALEAKTGRRVEYQDEEARKAGKG